MNTLITLKFKGKKPILKPLHKDIGSGICRAGDFKKDMDAQELINSLKGGNYDN
jgi:hypothetical protein